MNTKKKRYHRKQRKAATVDNVLKIIDIQKDAVTPRTVNYLLSYHITYVDMVLEEHLLNINDAVDEFDDHMVEGDRGNKTIIREVKRLHKLAAKNDAGYVRFIEH